MLWKMFCFYHLRMTFTQNLKKSTDVNEKPSIVCDRSIIVDSVIFHFQKKKNRSITYFLKSFFFEKSREIS